MADIKIALQVDANNPVIGDIYLNANRQMELTQTLAEQVIQELWIRFHFFFGEWFLDRSQGVPWLDFVLGQKPSDDLIGQICRTVILSVPAIRGIDTFTIVRDTARGIFPSFSVNLQDGTTLSSDDFPPLVLGSPG